MRIYKIKKISIKHLRKNVMNNTVWVEHETFYDAYRKGKIFGFWWDIYLRSEDLDTIKNYIKMYNEVYYNDEEYKIIEE